MKRIITIGNKANKRKLSVAHYPVRFALCTSLMLLSLTPAANATYMYSKAILAQYLIAIAWKKTLDNGRATHPWPWADTYPVAHMKIPHLDWQAWVLQGADGSSLAFGPGLLAGSERPGGNTGVSVIGGHRDTHFSALQYLQPNDRFSITNIAGLKQQYEVTSTSVADARYSSISTRSEKAKIVLVTCFPFDALQAGGPLRYVVEAVSSS